MNRVCAAEAAFLMFVSAGFATCATRAQAPPERNGSPSAQSEVVRDYNLAAKEKNAVREARAGELGAAEFRIGTNDLLEINIFEAPELNGKVRVAASGEISMPLLGPVQAGGLSAHELETLLESRLRKYMKDPHVGVLVNTVESHPISVLGAVHKPGVFQVRGPKSLLEMLSMAEGLAEDAGDSVLVMRGAGVTLPPPLTTSTGTRPDPTNSLQENATLATAEPKVEPEPAAGERTLEINLKNLLQSEDPRTNVTVYPGDVVKVVRAGLVYVVGEVKRPGGFVLKTNEQMTVLKAIALAEGLTNTSRKSRAKIIRVSSTAGENREIPINLGKILAGKAPDPALIAADVVFVPNSSGKTIAYKGSQVGISTLIGMFIWHW